MVVANKKWAHESQSNGIRFYYNRRWLCMDRIACNAWSGSCVPVHRFGDSNIGTQTDHAAACHSIHHWMGSSNIRHKCIDASGRPFLAWCERWCILRYGAYIYRWNCTVRHSWFTWKLLPAYVGHWCAVFIYCWCKNKRFCIQFDLCYHSHHFRHYFRIYARNAIIFDLKGEKRRSCQIIKMVAWRRIWLQQWIGRTSRTARIRQKEQSFIGSCTAASCNNQSDLHFFGIDVLPTNERHQCRHLLHERHFRCSRYGNRQRCCDHHCWNNASDFGLCLIDHRWQTGPTSVVVAIINCNVSLYHFVGRLFLHERSRREQCYIPWMATNCIIVYFHHSLLTWFW